MKLFAYFYLLILKFIKSLHSLFFREQNKKIIANPVSSIKDTTNKYTEFYCVKFSKSFDNLTEYNYDSNIDSVFYSKDSLKETLQDGKNGLEKIWKTRILFENSPRGNIVMHYDPYKLGFSYYCDQYVTYEILNAVAMKYVLTFNCRDFFVDELVRDESKASKLLFLSEDDKKGEKQESENVKKFKDSIKDAPFAKFKNYNSVSSKVAGNKEKNESIRQNKEPEKIKQRNRFINLGKVMNFQFMQKMPKTVPKFNSELSKDVFENGEVQKEVFNYRDYKKIKQFFN